MITDLVFKEYKETLPKDNSAWKIVLKIFGTILGLGLFVALETFIFFALDKKIIAFAGKEGTLDFLILFLVILLTASIIISTFKVRKVFYKRSDSEILLRLPVENDQVIVSKIIFVYLSQIVLNFVVSFPLLCCYGATRNFMPTYYVLSFLYPAFISLFAVGITLMLAPVFNKAYKFIAPRPYLQILLGSVLVIGMCFAYQYVLRLFIDLLNNSKFDSMFSAGFVKGLESFTNYAIPVSNLVNLILPTRVNFGQNLAIFLGVTIVILVLGFTVSSISYNYFLKNEFSRNKSETSKKKDKPLKLEKNLFLGLVKKEFILLFRDSNYIFSFTSLLIMQPFLAFVVISTLNKLLYANMTMFLHYFPELINALNLVLILLFASIIATSAMDVFSREGKALIVSKYIPVSPIKQTLAKILVPVTLSLFSLFVTSTVLISAREISVSIYFISFLLGILLILSLAISGVFIDLKKLNSKRTSNISFLSTFLSVVVPLVLFGLQALMMYFKVHTALMYSVLFILMALILLPLGLSFKRFVNKNFIEMRIN